MNNKPLSSEKIRLLRCLRFGVNSAANMQASLTTLNLLWVWEYIDLPMANRNLREPMQSMWVLTEKGRAYLLTLPKEKTAWDI